MGVLGLRDQDLVHLANLVIVSDLGSDVLPLAAPVIPIDLGVHKRLGVVFDSVQHAAVGVDWRALSATALALEEEVPLAHVPGLAADSLLEAVFANELVAGLIEVLEALEDVRAEESALVVHYGPLAVVALLGPELNVERDQSVSVRDQVLARDQSRRAVEHATDVQQLQGVAEEKQSLQQALVSIEL